MAVQSGNVHERAIDDFDDFQRHGESSQVRYSQMSSQDHLRDPLSSLSFSSQLRYGMEVGHHSGEMGVSSQYLDGATPVNAPTPLGQRLQEEEKNSSHGSRPSIAGSRQSVTGSRASIGGSRPSIQGSKSSFLNAGHYSQNDIRSAAPMSNQDRRLSMDETVLSLPPSIPSFALHKTGSTQSSVDESQVPTRGSPMGIAPLAMSHQLPYKKNKDFASLTCLPNPSDSDLYLGGPEDFPPMHEPLSPSLKSDEFDTSGDAFSPSVPSHSEFSSPLRRASTSGNKLELLTSVDSDADQNVTSTTKLVPTTRTRSTSDASPIGRKRDEDDKKPLTSSSSKKPRSRAMSKLEKITSLDYIRASLRMKKRKKVSFDRSDNPSPADSQKRPQLDSLTLTNPATVNHDSGASPKRSPIAQATALPSSKRDHPLEDSFSPSLDVHPEDVFHRGMSAGRPRAYSDMAHMQAYTHLSQPTYYPQSVAQFNQPGAYPHLSQQYYPAPQLSQGSYYHHPQAQFAPPSSSTPHASVDQYGRRYSDGISPYSDVGVPSAYQSRLPRQPDPDARRPERERYRDTASPDRLSEVSSATDSRLPNVHSPDGSAVSDRYQTRSPDRYTDTSERSFGQLDLPDPYIPMHGYDGYSPQHGYGLRAPDHRRDLDTRYWAGGGGGGGSQTPDQFHDSLSHPAGMYPADYHHYQPQRVRTPERQLDGFPSSQGVEPGYQPPYGPPPVAGQQNGSRRSSLQSDMSGLPEFSRRGSVLSDASGDTSTSKARVSWNTQVIEYPRTPSDAGSEPEYDFQ